MPAAISIPNNLLSLSESPLLDIGLDIATKDFHFSTNQQTLYLHNKEPVVSLGIKIIGDGVANFACDGIEDQDVSGGLLVTVAPGEIIPIVTFGRRGYFGSPGNTVTVTVDSLGPATALSRVWTTSN